MVKKEYMYKGKTLEELQAMDVKEFAQVVPARIRRSLLRGFSEEQQKLLLKIQKGKKLRTHLRDMVILPNMVGKTISIHQGKSFQDVIINAEMIGHVLGEFSLTRKNAGHSKPGVGKKRK